MQLTKQLTVLEGQPLPPDAGKSAELTGEPIELAQGAVPHGDREALSKQLNKLLKFHCRSKRRKKL